MPIYQYECDTCGVRFERMQRMSDEPLTECPECDGKVHRVIQPVGIIFKGSGFYITDNRQVSSPTLTPPKDSDKASADKSSGDKSSADKETKPATTTPASTEKAES
jgi:putative FmdB family regulatory protein